MLRYRRYRVFVVFAVLTLLVLWQFAGSDTWRSSGFGVKLSGSGGAPAAGQIPDELVPPPAHPIANEDEHDRPDVVVPSADKDKTKGKTRPPTIDEINRKPTQKGPPASLETTATGSAPAGAHKPDDASSPYLDSDVVGGVPHEPQIVVPQEQGEGRKEIYADPSATAIHWKKLPEHFPVSSTIHLPSGTPKSMPKIQATFAKETTAERKEREAKLAAIREAASFSWQGYRNYAWMADELSPVSNGSRNPFAGWGATLVDSLDTLYILGMYEEFEEAVEAVKDIDFTTSFRKDIPLFETVIRYLGGLVAAYDISEKKHKILLDKAVELAEILIGAFDTPNRMPITFYYWMPTYASQPHRAGTRVVLAEIGSLSVEFTRLAQLTKEHKYYDAIARITNAFLEWEDTRLPGMWPVHVDASGCKRPSSISEGREKDLGDAFVKTSATSSDSTSGKKPDSKSSEPVNKNNPARFGGKNPVPDDEHDDLSDDLSKRQLDDPISLSKAAKEAAEDEVRTEKASVKASETEEEEATPTKSKASASPTLADCLPQGLDASSPSGNHQFTLGGMSDSMYEYFPKEYLLLGGLAPEYKDLYVKSADVVKKKLLYRPMLPEDAPDMLFAGTLQISPPSKDGKKKQTESLKAEGTHLTCFAGGMFAYGAKIFGRTEDVKIGAQLTEGCVWAYNVTSTGIMPESFLLTPCETLERCEWNETAWHEELDPYAKGRAESYESQMQYYSAQVDIARHRATASPSASEDMVSIATAAAEKPANGVPPASVPKKAIVDKRQLGDVRKGEFHSYENSPSSPSRTTYSDAHEPADYDDAGETDPVIAHIWKPQKPLSHAEYVSKRIEEERLPEGWTSVQSKHYILRPEAIESVWYMYRITGDSYWREAGWNMFLAIQKHCRAQYGYSAIDDVTMTAPRLKDEMESFWIAETLKYFYLLFADEDLVSLDEWVLNTEAHPFRRPDAETDA